MYKIKLYKIQYNIISIINIKNFIQISKTKIDYSNYSVNIFVKKVDFWEKTNGKVMSVEIYLLSYNFFNLFLICCV